MGNSCSELITSVVVLPITAGNYRRRQNGSRYYDGTLSSLVFFLIFLATVIILTFSKDIDIGQDKRLAIVFILLAVIMVLGMFACAIVGCFIKTYGLGRVVLRRQERSVTKLQLIFLWIFGIGSGWLSAFLAGQQFQCDILSQKIDGGGDVFWYSRGIFNVILTIILFIQITFINYFVQFQMKCSTSVRYSLFILVGANVSVWLHSIITDNESFPENIPGKHFRNNSKILACLRNETIGFLLDISNPILDPCLLEFCLLSTMLLFEMWSPNTLQTSSEGTFSRDDSRTYRDNVESNYTLNDTERNPLLGNANQNPENSLSRHGVTRTVYHLIVLVLSIVVTIGNVICYVVWVMHPNSGQIRLVIEQFGLVELCRYDRGDFGGILLSCSLLYTRSGT
ncbi:uncharacterized protein LOC110465873 [Mizuhopecten yessoensis]|uniref:uncharacterized protein LOC110465873 n=1 Tax=Mizuhopecten yessoensis TaxID=6573 RepID=UPI000B45D876|nr:uncharacterized protein LOC110465873 [Mizuhopecten yessoensis]